MKPHLETTHKLFFYFFIASLGLIYPLSISEMSKVIYLSGLLVFGIAYFNDWKTWLCEHPDERRYLVGIISFVLYGVTLILIWKFFVPDDPSGLKKSYGDGENLLMYYLALPLFCCVIGLRLKQKTFERAMIFFSIFTVLSGIFLLFVYHDIKLLFDAPASFFKEVLQDRFADCESKISWINIFLKDFSFFPTLGALVCIPFMMKFTGWRRAFMIIVALLNVALLFFTISKGPIISLGLVVVLTIFYSLRKFSWKKTLLWGSCIVVVSCAIILLLPESIKIRFTDMVKETLWFFESGHNRGSTSCRLTIWTTLLSHADSFWLFGDGPIYATDKLRLYLLDAGHVSYVEHGYVYHNLYLSFFHHFGIVGLLFLLFLLLYPIYITIRRKQFSPFLTSVVILFACGYIEDRYTKSTILLFFLYFSFFHVKKWREIERKSSS